MGLVAKRCPSEKSFFFFSSRRRHTRWPRDWSSDVCSSDLVDDAAAVDVCHLQLGGGQVELDGGVHETRPTDPAVAANNVHEPGAAIRSLEDVLAEVAVALSVTMALALAAAVTGVSHRRRRDGEC